MVASIASIQNKKYNLMGFHGKFVEGREYDESTFANLVASSAGINLIEKVITEEDFVRNISKVI